MEFTIYNCMHTSYILTRLFIHISLVTLTKLLIFHPTKFEKCKEISSNTQEIGSKGTIRCLQNWGFMSLRGRFPAIDSLVEFKPPNIFYLSNSVGLILIIKHYLNFSRIGNEQIQEQY